MHLLPALAGLLLGISTLSLQAKPLSLSPGLWEGISEDEMQYKLLQINDCGEHFLYEIHIPSGLRYAKRSAFSDEDISCKENRCTISTIIEEDVTRSLTLSPYLDTSFTALESNYNDNKGLLSTSYRLIKQESSSTPRKFLEKYGNLLNNAERANDETPYGLWVGILHYLDKPELALLQLYEDRQGSLTVFRKGGTSELAISTQISPENISLQHPIVEITTSHTTFATHLFLMSEGNSVLKGYAYAVHKGVTLDAGEIKLFDITKYLSLN